MSEPTSIHSTPESDAHTQALQAQIQKLELLSHRPFDSAVLARPESAQEESVQDLPRKAIQQRRQVLEGCLTELRSATETEAAGPKGKTTKNLPR